ncbi:hypothetical protein PILCRDRAFT_813733 [Piloderma croceum F 1598]|uniref:Uncharacterized protein n=1 Tax=Piloderma croceum (strain F 1598) TaxID=765440 RepID=A0A0C3GDP3_PILCF|nr:hypothetical protein PILCRDRAFT_813733 [Piloderma croceum F 1598]
MPRTNAVPRHDWLCGLLTVAIPAFFQRNTTTMATTPAASTPVRTNEKVCKALSSREHVDVHEVLSDKEAEEFSLSKLRLKRRLHDRWKCKAKEHTYCYVDARLNLHIQLSDPNIDRWVDIIHDGYATLLHAPKFLLPSISSLDDSTLDTSSINSKNSITYQRPFHFQFQPDLSDLRSWRNNLSSKSSSMSSSSSSSVIPSPGYIAGSAAIWVGTKIISLVITVDSRRRIWRATRLTKRMKKVPGPDLQAWLVDHRQSVNQLVDDLLELSSDDYKAGIQRASIKHGSRFHASLIEVEYHHVREYSSIYWLLSSKASPFAFFSNEKGETMAKGLGVSFRELLLQEPIDTKDFEGALPELVGCACDELLFGFSSASRTLTFKVIFNLLHVPQGQTELERLGQPGGCMHELANRMINGHFSDNEEQLRAVQFFCRYADKLPTFREYIFTATDHLLSGFQSTVKDGPNPFPDSAKTAWTCSTLGTVTHYPWGIPKLLDLDICNIIARTLLVHRKAGCPDPWVDYNLVWVLHNVFDRGGDEGKTSVRKVFSTDVHSTLKNLMRPEVPWAFEDTGNHVRKWITNMGGGTNEVSEKSQVENTPSKQIESKKEGEQGQVKQKIKV